MLAINNHGWPKWSIMAWSRDCFSIIEEVCWGHPFHLRARCINFFAILWGCA